MAPLKGELAAKLTEGLVASSPQENVKNPDFG